LILQKTHPRKYLENLENQRKNLENQAKNLEFQAENLEIWKKFGAFKWG
jgi:hypothetical protein